MGNKRKRKTRTNAYRKQHVKKMQNVLRARKRLLSCTSDNEESVLTSLPEDVDVEVRSVSIIEANKSSQDILAECDVSKQNIDDCAKNRGAAILSSNAANEGNDDTELNILNANQDRTKSKSDENEIITSNPYQGETSVPKIDENEDMELNIEIFNANQVDSSMPRTALEGRRIVNMVNLYQKLQEISSHGPFNCTLKCVDIVNEKQDGLKSTYTLKCRLCNMKFFISSDEGSEMDINNCAVVGAVSIGCGHSQLQELSAALSLPLMSEKKYSQCHDTIANVWDKISIETMEDAAKEEREIAISNGQIDENGVPIIDVIVDGCWSKRTYKKNYSALSGAAAVIGRRTGKVLYLGVKNKYCCICARAESKNLTPREHACYKNYSGPSTGMESHILVEAFKCSVSMHGLIYGRMISDGDSSTYAKIIEARPYRNVTVQKIECKNHIMRNMCNKIAQLKSDTKYPARLRKNITDKKILAIRGTIKKAIIRYTSDSESEKRAHVELLYNDILLAHLHAFGNHSRCKKYFCTSSEPEDTSDHDFQTSGLWSKICQILSNVASHAPSLVHNVQSNTVENFNSTIAKLVGGKRVNYSLRRGYDNRCKGAAISHNTRSLLSKTYKHVTGKSPKGKIKLLEDQRFKKRNVSKKYIKRKIKFVASKGEDSNYGENCTREDITSEMMEKEKVTFLNNLVRNEEERRTIEKNTKLQSASSEWLEMRRKLLTASNFGLVIKKRKDTSCQNLVKNLLYKDCISHVKSIQHGISNEKIAIEQLSNQEGLAIKPCGLFIDENLPYLGASPDGVYENNLVEIKCPISAYKLNFEDAVKNKKIPFFKMSKDGGIRVNTDHNWYYQIQGQLHITKKEQCLFGLWLGENIPIKTEIIKIDDEFWKTKMEPRLTRFYMDCILPELIDPRHTRNMTIRDPMYIQEAKKNKDNKLKLTKKNNEKIGKDDKINKDSKSKIDTIIVYNEDHNNENIHNAENQNNGEKIIKKSTKRKQPDIHNENKENKIKKTENEHISDFVNTLDQSDTTETNAKKILSERQLNFNEF